MSIERVSTGSMAPLITQRFEVSNATALEPGKVLALVPIGPYMAAAPDAGPGLPAAQAAPPGQNGVAAEAAARDSGAMQANQLFFSRQLVWHAPDPAALGASWRVMVKTYGEQRAALQEQARGQHVPGGVFMAEQNTTLREGNHPPLTMDAEAWRFAVFGWGGQRLSLRVLASDPDRERARRHRRGKVALRLELALGELGRVMVQMEPSADGVFLELAADEPLALAALRARLSELASAIGHAGLRIVRCRIARAPHPVQVHNNDSMQCAAAELSPPMFRAMAEVALLLSRPPEREPLPARAAQPAPPDARNTALPAY